MTAPAGLVVPDDRREELRRRLGAPGFDAVRFAAVTETKSLRLREWLAAGHHADLHWMDRTAAKREDPELVLPGTRSVVLLGVNYLGGAGQAPAAGKPRWARYALHADYHDTMQAGLAAAGRVLEEMTGAASTDYRYYVDTGPVLERGWAARSGLGFLGKNGMLISRAHGNWLFLAAILTRVRITPDEPLKADARPGDGGEPAGLLCGTCTRCMDACPTAAFPRPGIVDARRCISYHTIENKGVIPRELRPGIGDRVYGCDACLEVCPWNRFAREGRRLLLSARDDLAALDLAELLALTPARFAAIFKGTAIKRLKLAGLLRNACVVAGNTGGRELLPALVALAAHESAIVRAHAVWAVRRLAGETEAATLLRPARERETEAAVLAEYAGQDFAANSSRMRSE
jgi:epoxyqueuosine reductase